MNTTLHSFIDIFDTSFSDGSEGVKLQKIIIPKIQRDYAQGRRDPDIDRVRKRFLDSLYKAVTQEPITLDFVYGDVDQNGVMTPLDGQQRLTTLFLLHWYASRKGGIPAEDCSFLLRFGYETRYSARDFCTDLVSFVPSFKGCLSEEIVDQAWFPLDWLKDPTIASMLVMLDDIDRRFCAVPDLWERLKDGAITFYFLPIRDMGLTDELYIKMNSRGKPLTRFEHFKAELERCLRAVDEASAKRIMRKIDRDWTDLLWQYRDSGSGSADDAVTDDEFLRYFRFVCDVICYQEGGSPQGKITDEFDLLTMYYTGKKESVLQNIATLEAFFDCWCHIPGFQSPAAFLSSCLSHSSAPGKIVVERSDEIDIFGDCLHSYADRSGRQRLFPLNRIVLLYALTCFLQNRSLIPDEEFSARLRSINNLIQNSADELSDRADGNRLPAIMAQTRAVMLNGTVDASIDNSFNVNQIAEELEKKAFLEAHPDKKTQIHQLEDHPYLKGQIGIIGLDHVDLADRFVSLFTCDRDLIDRALMSIGDYGQQERNKSRYQYGSKGMKSAWDSLFHKSSNIGFSRTHSILIGLLNTSVTFTDDLLRTQIKAFIGSCEAESLFPWRYYYVKYDVFRPGRYGKYDNKDALSKPYLFSVLMTRYQWSATTYMPYLKAADPGNHSIDHPGQRLEYGDQHIICKNDCYVLRSNETNTEIETVPIPQNEKGIDTEDRILLLKRFISERGLN